MSFSPGEKVVVRNTLVIVVSDETVAGQEFVGVVDPRAIQLVPASQVNQPPAPAGPATPAMPPGPAGPVHPGPARPGRPQ